MLREPSSGIGKDARCHGPGTSKDPIFHESAKIRLEEAKAAQAVLEVPTWPPLSPLSSLPLVCEFFPLALDMCVCVCVYVCVCMCVCVCVCVRERERERVPFTYEAGTLTFESWHLE